MHCAHVHGRNVLLVRVEAHGARNSVVLLNVSESIVNAGAIEAGLADGVEQHVHRVVGKRRELLGLLLEASVKAAIEIEPARIVARGIVGEDSLEAFGRGPCLSQHLRPQCAIGAEDALLHSESTHLLEDLRGGNFVAPDDDGIGARRLNDFQLARVIGIAGKKFLLNDNRMAKAPRGIAKLKHAKTAVAAVDAEQGNTLQTELAINSSGQREALHAIVLQVSEVPGNVGFRNGGISRS